MGGVVAGVPFTGVWVTIKGCLLSCMGQHLVPLYCGMSFNFRMALMTGCFVICRSSYLVLSRSGLTMYKMAVIGHVEFSC